MIYYRQCHLRRGKQWDISWLPEKYAKVGKILKLKNNGAWEDGWEVTYVAVYRFSEAQEDDRDTPASIRVSEGSSSWFL